MEQIQIYSKAEIMVSFKIQKNLKMIVKELLTKKTVFFTDRQIRQVIADLFTAGMETIKNTIQFAILYMIHHPESLRAVQDELDQIVGRNRLPKLEDLPYLPTTESTLYEVMRISSIVPLGTEHSPIR